MELNWVFKSFSELSSNELYDILKLRSEVFVVEQQCIFLDMDDKDKQSWHLIGNNENEIAAYVRILPPGVSYAEMSIGRVVTSPRARRKGAGRILMLKAISTCIEIFGNQPIRIGAQLYLKNFYNSLGFEPCSDIYLEDGIEHIEMLMHT
jgi:ElaA protein